MHLATNAARMRFKPNFRPTRGAVRELNGSALLVRRAFSLAWLRRSSDDKLSLLDCTAPETGRQSGKHSKAGSPTFRGGGPVHRSPSLRLGAFPTCGARGAVTN